MPEVSDEQLERALASRAPARVEPAGTRLVSTPLLAALRAAGTRHVYADSADVEELRPLLAVGADGLRREVDGNTANQPLVRRVLERYLDAGDVPEWALLARAHGAESEGRRLQPVLYAVVCARIGNDMTRAFALDRPWQGSLQLHMALGHEPRAARRVARLLHRMAPGAVVKVPFRPDAPDCFLLARDLQRAGIAVNFTSTFSARQAVAAALLGGVALTNVFLGRIDQGLEAEGLGEHVTREAQRALARLRASDGAETLLIAASMREWRTFVRLAGVDVFTSPCPVLHDFLAQEEVPPEALANAIEPDAAFQVSATVRERLGDARIARLYEVERDLVEFLRGVRDAPDFDALDGEALHRRFESAGFADLFHVPTGAERDELAQGKLPRLDGALVERVPLDTHYSLLANADFERAQHEIDEAIAKRLEEAP